MCMCMCTTCTCTPHTSALHTACTPHAHAHAHVHEPAPGAPRGAAAGRRDDMGTHHGTGHAVRGGPDGMPTARAPARRLQPCALEAATLYIRGRNPAPPCSRRHRLGQGHYLPPSPTISHHLPPSPTISHHLPLSRAALPRARARWHVTCARRWGPLASTATSSRTRCVYMHMHTPDYNGMCTASTLRALRA